MLFRSIVAGLIGSQAGQTIREIYGNEGEYFVGGEGYAGQESEDTIIDYNTPPGQIGVSGLDKFEAYWEESRKRIREGKCQPGLWLQWKIEEINYKNLRLLNKFLTERGKIIPRRVTNVSVKKQRALTDAIKMARHLALISPIAKEMNSN